MMKSTLRGLFMLSDEKTAENVQSGFLPPGYRRKDRPAAGESVKR